MRGLVLLCLFCLLRIPVAGAEEKPAPPGEPPQIWRAFAKDVDGKIVIQISRQDYVTPRRPASLEEMLWEDLRPVILGETIHAHDRKGKPIESKTVLSRLAEPKAVVVFVRHRDSTAILPDPFYLAAFGEEVVIFIANADEIFSHPIVP